MSSDPNTSLLQSNPIQTTPSPGDRDPLFTLPVVSETALVPETGNSSLANSI